MMTQNWKNKRLMLYVLAVLLFGSACSTHQPRAVGAAAPMSEQRIERHSSCPESQELYYDKRADLDGGISGTGHKPGCQPIHK